MVSVAHKNLAKGEALAERVAAFTRARGGWHDIAAVAEFLISDAAARDGMTINIDGGMRHDRCPSATR